MHRKHLQIILLAAAVDPVIRKHAMTETDIAQRIRELRPTLANDVIVRASKLAMTSAPVS